MKNLALTLALLTLASPATAEEHPGWIHVDTVTSGTEIYVLEADIERGRSNQRAARLWMLQDARNDSTVEWYEAKVLNIVDCVARTYKMITMTTYKASGEVDASENIARPETEHVIPGTVMGDAVEALCSDPEGFDT